MSDNTPPPDDQTSQPPPTWGNAYPPPGQGYPPPPGYGYPAYPPRQKHPSATTAMVLGLVSVVGGFLCYLPLFIAPFAWFTGSRTIREIDEGHGVQDGRGEAVAGKILGIIGTIFLTLALAVVILFLVLTLTVDNFWQEFWEES